MPSARDCADRLREQAYKTLIPQVGDLQEEFQKVSSLLSAGIKHVETKLEALRHTELPATDLVLDEFLQEALQKRDLEGKSLSLFMHDLRIKETQEEILALLLDSAVHYFPRVALFAVRGDRFSGWSSRGFGELTARSISSHSFLQSECVGLQEALKNSHPSSIPELTGDDSLRLIQDEAQGSWQLFPLHILQRPVAILIAGETNGMAGRPEALSIVMDCTALRLENISLKILNALGSAKPQTIYQAASAPAVQPAAEPNTVFESKPVSQEPVTAKEPIRETLVPSSSPEERPNDWLAGKNILTAPITAPQVADIPEDEKLHSTAKRFARLLVSEIKLYNENSVAEGQKNRDVYLRLKKDIDRSREMYEKRVAPIVARKIDYFHDELVRILGNNDINTLGNDYPGPRIES
jgi:hypothetical protein